MLTMEGILNAEAIPSTYRRRKAPAVAYIIVTIALGCVAAMIISTDFHDMRLIRAGKDSVAYQVAQLKGWYIPLADETQH
jgi:hypothetical protein